MEGLQGHLGGGLGDTLGGDGANGFAWFYEGSAILSPTLLQKSMQLGSAHRQLRVHQKIQLILGWSGVGLDLAPRVPVLLEGCGKLGGLIEQKPFHLAAESRAVQACLALQGCHKSVPSTGNLVADELLHPQLSQLTQLPWHQPLPGLLQPRFLRSRLLSGRRRRLLRSVALQGAEMGERMGQIQRLPLALHHHGRQGVVTVYKLNDISNTGSHRHVVLERHILQCLHQSSCHVPGLSCLHRRIHQPLAPTHGVEKKTGGLPGPGTNCFRRSLGPLGPYHPCENAAAFGAQNHP
mmetsp:Transcript_68256/g.156716  ORF Transcript_68256/g.156716 Transcript_68256/m.156716 type:complete len:294 (+) Transcript_68256:1374-2255(+)